MRPPKRGVTVGEDRPLRKGWTTGACATAATKAALTALTTGAFPDPVTITLPRGGTAAFCLAHEHLAADFAEAAIIKDAGDDPDVTHGATVRVRVRWGASGVRFFAGSGVGTVTRPGLPLAVGEPAINPVPRAMMETAVAEVAGRAAVDITVSIDGGAALAEKTWNGRLGIVGGLSILGTTGVVRPFSCAAWIHSIHRGVDVARAANLSHIAAATGATSEAAVRAALGLPLHALIDMGDFAGGLLKYVRAHPVKTLTIAGGFAKLSKLAAGALDLHSARSAVDTAALAALATEEGAAEPLAARIREAPTGLAALEFAQVEGLDLAAAVARRAQQAATAVAGPAVAIEIMVVSRAGAILAWGRPSVSRAEGTPE
ncbi:MAG: cobalt-precorrin-5B (C(1))-methyltransferase [Pseudomonadota bacterium]